MLSEFRCTGTFLGVTFTARQLVTPRGANSKCLHGETFLPEVIPQRGQVYVIWNWRWQFILVKLKRTRKKCMSKKPLYSHLRNIKTRDTHLEHDRNHLFTDPRPHTRPHLQDYATHTPDVDLKVVSLLLRIDNLRCHPEYCALHSGECASGLVICPLRDTKIGNFANSRHLNKYIIRFQILGTK